ncbi:MULTISPECIES: hypothetical protein [Thalassospira]|uniref:Uncharacterized protein n=2 Tax=Thalassospira TaxID=168934 RepID=A0A367W994_9PROT|nr:MULTISPECIES: hypothetical protein [Thalassospira]MDG4718049.1 hypothetical protein [Thalassospira sp. FZY0004]RCK37829.1 hypothetical protein TH19_07265 [Thalassospira profundimaris]
MREISIEELAAGINRKKAELGYSGTDYVARNSGKYRTESKRALLRSLTELAAKKGRPPKFKANY